MAIAKSSDCRHLALQAGSNVTPLRYTCIWQHCFTLLQIPLGTLYSPTFGTVTTGLVNITIPWQYIWRSNTGQWVAFKLFFWVLTKVYEGFLTQSFINMSNSRAGNRVACCFMVHPKILQIGLSVRIRLVILQYWPSKIVPLSLIVKIFGIPDHRNIRQNALYKNWTPELF